MKKLVLLVVCLLSAQTFATTGTDLLNARDAAIDEATVEMDINTVEAFEVTPESDHEVLVALKAGEDVHKYGCHYHGDDMACHEEGHDHAPMKSGHDEGAFEKLQELHAAAIAKLNDTLTRQESDLNVLKTIKVWKVEKTEDDGHSQGPDVWTKVKYDRNGKELTVFVICHVELDHDHKDEEKIGCHYKRKGKGEPTL